MKIYASPEKKKSFFIILLIGTVSQYLDGCAPVDISGEAQLLQAVPVEEGEAAGSCLEWLPGQTLPARLVPVQLGQCCCRLLELNTGGTVSTR